MSKILRLLSLSALLSLFSLSAGAADKPWAIDEVMGRADAPITIIEYSSLTCPHCARFEAEVLPQVKKEWIDSGKARFIMRDYIRNSLDLAGAMIAHCSGDRYFVFIDTFFHSQANWIQAAQPLDALKGIARLGGVSAEETDKCLQNRDLLNEINARRDDAGKRYDMIGTPTFVINGTVAPDKAWQNYENFAKFLADHK